jgi:formylglycine-generating enzyme
MLHRGPRTAGFLVAAASTALIAASCAQVIGLGDFHDGICNPGDKRDCYDGPAGTEGVGICKPGSQTCDADGQAWGKCVGEVVPKGGDICGNQADDDCNGVVDDQCLCNDGDKDCVGQTPRACVGATWVAQAACGGATPLCVEGACQPCNGQVNELCVCKDGDAQCVGQTPQVCSNGSWVAQPACGGTTPVCLAGTCVKCTDGEVSCEGSTPTKCVGGDWVPQTACTSPYPACKNGQCVPPSCLGGGQGAGNDCGPTGSSDCCAGSTMPGGTFNRDNNASYPATISAFGLDLYEVTVGRFRAFVEAGGGTQANPPVQGSGAFGAPLNGWSTSWTAKLATDTAALKAALKCADPWTWTDMPGPNERRPMNCVTWYEAFAFCTWDGSRLPSEAEWSFAGTGGDEQRFYPWGGDPATLPTLAQASYACGGDGTQTGCGLWDLFPVGTTSPGGDGRWGQSDLAGNVAEWVYDWYASPYYNATCDDCWGQYGTERGIRGGAWNNGQGLLWNTFRMHDLPEARSASYGIRCARVSVQ